MPACRTLDCISIFALTVEDAALVAHIAGGFDPGDPDARARSITTPAGFPERPRLGVPRHLEFFGDTEAEAAYGRALARATAMGAELLPIDFAPFSALGAIVEATRTAAEYRLFALTASAPPKPALVRVPPAETGSSIEVELWDVPMGCFGSFVAEIRPPVEIGNVAVTGGRVVKGFICEPYGIAGAQDISAFGGWRAYRASLAGGS